MNILAPKLTSSMNERSIKIRGARVHNLKDISVDLPKDKLVVITGPSGSGKSSLAIDTLFAEGHRKYIEALSVRARQLIGMIEKPDVDYIEGLAPAIAIEQKMSIENPRSIIATSTEIYDFLRALYAYVGEPHCPTSGKKMEAFTPTQIVDKVLELPKGTRLIILAPLIQGEKGGFQDVLDRLAREGFVRVRIDGQITELDSDRKLRIDAKQPHWIELVVDRVIVDSSSVTRIADSIEIALRWGKDRVLFLYQLPSSKTQGWESFMATTKLMSPVTGQVYDSFTPRHFSFNSPLGACEVCKGIGYQPAIDPRLVIPDPQKSISQGAIAPFVKAPRRIIGIYQKLIEEIARFYKINLEAPFAYLPEHFKKLILWGNLSELKSIDQCNLDSHPKFEGLIPLLQRMLDEAKSNSMRKWLESYTTSQLCRACKGQRLKPEVLAVTLGGEKAIHKFDKWLKYKKLSPTIVPGLSIMDVCSLPISKAVEFFEWLNIDQLSNRKIAEELINVIKRRLLFLCQVGVGYLTLDRENYTLSGGEIQRIRLATQIGSGLTGVLYVLDEPSIGLHPKDNDRLIQTLKELRDQGNTVVVVEHDPEMILNADYVIDLGPGAGVNGGHVIVAGTIQELLKHPDSLTAKYLRGELLIPGAELRKQKIGEQGWLIVKGAREHNLKNITAHFPIGAITCVTGVSGSGKSTLVDEILRKALAQRLYKSSEPPGEHDEIIGADRIHRLVVVDQSPIGRSPRSNPATYTGLFNEIRELFAKTPAARIRGFKASRFSFNVSEGRCPKCQGDGYIKIELEFLPPVYVTCDACGGKRYNRETLEITYKGLNIADVLDLTIEEAAHFFRTIPSIAETCRLLCEIGLGYLKLGQPANTLSGGESQRLKLASELSRKSPYHTLYILDEPTTGLHFYDIAKLMEVLFRLRDAGHTLIIIEHNLEVIKGADWVIDLGPDAGDNGGWIVAEGPPEFITKCNQSYTGQYLKRVLQREQQSLFKKLC